MKTVLVVEDERTYARIITNWLIKNGMNARYVLSISAAKEFVLGQKIDLILSDFNLPGGNCMELFSWMRANGYRIPFLIMTGFGNIEKAVDVIKRGVDNY